MNPGTAPASRTGAGAPAGKNPPLAEPVARLGIPYRTLAPHYNQIMAHVDYRHWARHYRSLWVKYRGRKPPKRVLELAAGTCPFAVHDPFPTAFTVHTDLSHGMLCATPAGVAGALKRVACDARSPGVRGPFDLVYMAYDSLNYLLQPREVLATFRAAFALLPSGGLFLFDVTTEGCSRRHFSHATEFGELDPRFPGEPFGGSYVRVSRYDAGTRMQLNLFTFFLGEPDGRFIRREEIHRQRVYPAIHLKKMAAQAGFRVRACLADFSFLPGNDRQDRLHFVLQKP